MSGELPLRAIDRKSESIGNAELVINLAQAVLDSLLGGAYLPI